MITIYAKPGCVPCREAKRLLDQRNIEYFECDLSQPEVMESFKAAHPKITVAPAIFEDGEYIGGYSELRERFFREITSEAGLLEG
jgi:glutaredoxin